MKNPTTNLAIGQTTPPLPAEAPQLLAFSSRSDVSERLTLMTSMTLMNLMTLMILVALMTLMTLVPEGLDDPDKVKIVKEVKRSDGV